MKAIKLIVKNVGIVADATIELNKPLIIFYGEIRQGKTTLLNAVKWVFGGSYPTDIIRKGETEAGMLSTSQMMKLSSQLSALYPEGFGLDLIDRAESLGKSIFAFVDRAKAENKTILAAVVGEKPAEVPEEVGVFVVEGGVIK